jgi:hypothetical protein
MTAPITSLPGGRRIMHRLRLAVEVLDQLSSRPVTAPVEIQRIGSRRRLTSGAGDSGRFVLLFSRQQLSSHDLAAFPPRTATLRLIDRSRQYVPRRFEVELRQPADVEAVDREPPGNPVPALARLLRVWLSPGAAYQPGGGFTLLRGRVLNGTEPVRWPRLAAAQGPGMRIVGRAHGDEKGEFLLPIVALGSAGPIVTRPVLPVTLLVWARGPGGPPPPTAQQLAADPLADLPVDTIALSAVPPAAADLDSPLLRGEQLPPFYVRSTAPAPMIDAEIGGHQLLRDPLTFTP